MLSIRLPSPCCRKWQELPCAVRGLLDPAALLCIRLAVVTLSNRVTFESQRIYWLKSQVAVLSCEDLCLGAWGVRPSRNILRQARHIPRKQGVEPSRRRRSLQADHGNAVADRHDHLTGMHVLRKMGVQLNQIESITSQRCRPVVSNREGKPKNKQNDAHLNSEPKRNM